jgi:hypothetical protein
LVVTPKHWEDQGMTREKRERLALGVTFFLMNLTLAVLALLPLSTVIVAESLVVFSAVVGGTLVLLNISDRAHANPVVRFSYAITGATATYTLIAYSLTAVVVDDIKIPTAMALATFSIGAYAAHILLETDDAD